MPNGVGSIIAAWIAKFLTDTTEEAVTKFVQEKSVGLFGIGTVDEGRLIELINVVRTLPGNKKLSLRRYDALLKLWRKLDGHQKNALCIILTSMEIFPYRETVPKIIKDKNGEKEGKESVEINPRMSGRDPRVKFLIALADDVIRLGVAAVKKDLIALRLIFNETRIKRILQWVREHGITADNLEQGILSALGVATLTELEQETEQERQRYERRKGQFWMEWFWSAENPVYTVFVVVGGLTGFGLIASFFMTAPK